MIEIGKLKKIALVQQSQISGKCCRTNKYLKADVTLLHKRLVYSVSQKASVVVEYSFNYIQFISSMIKFLQS